MYKKRNWISIVMMVMIAFTFFYAGDSQAVSPVAAPIRLNNTIFNPGLGERPQVPLGLTISSYAAGQRGYYIVQSSGPVQESWKNQVSALGGELLEYIPDFAFKVRMNPAQAARVAALGDVAWVGIFQPAYKLSPKLDMDGSNLVRVRVERGSNFGQVRSAIARSGAQVLSHEGEFLLVEADGEQLQAIANILDVAWVENYVLPVKLNEYGAGVILGANIANVNYDGSTQIAAVADTGLGGGTDDTAHVDIPSERIVSIYNWPGAASGCFQTISDDGAIDVDSGHGTHTATSVLGDGGASGEGKGTAPAASLVFQATENWATTKRQCQRSGGWPAEGYFLTGLPDDLRLMYQQAYNDGARIHSNSWGSSLAGEYTVDSANTDDFIWTNPDMSITFSAGNAGIDANANGVVDNDSIGSPATAKNVITIGASENARPDDFPCDSGLTYVNPNTGTSCASLSGSNELFTYGEAWPDDFPADPLTSDPSAGNAEQLAAFSSRGPTDDGRIKPDVVAPGTWVLSGYSALYQEGYGDPPNPQNDVYQYDGWGFPLNDTYKYMGGTSMSNPIVAGAATVMRDFYQKVYSHSASAALVKASLINSAVDLEDENNDGVDDNDFPIPNVHEGWGRVNLANATDGSHQFVEEYTGLSTGGTAGYPFTVASSGTPFKVTLVWSDFPSTEAAAANLVNDLDLLVTDPGGTQYRGNVFSGGWSQTGGSADRVNNVENVYIQSAAAGTWTVQVSGYNIPNGPQPYALVVNGNMGTADTPPTVTVANPSEGATVSGLVTITADASDDFGVTQVEFFVDGTSIGLDGSAPYSASWDSTTAADGGHVISATATDSIEQTGSDSVNVTVDNVNDPPVAAFSFTCDGLSCNFDASDSYDPDGTITDYDWDFGDSSIEIGVTPNHIYTADGTYTVVLTVTDNDGATDTDTQDVTVSDTVLVTVHVGDLDGSSATASRNRWDATVTITVHDNDERTVSGALVEGVWSDGASGGASCITNTSGQCIVTMSDIKSKVNSVTFSVNNITSSDIDYVAGDNHDPDGDSSGTAITVGRP